MSKIEKAVGHEMAFSSVYKLLHRHNWRKLAPDKRHAQSDALRQEEWKKLRERFIEINAQRPRPNTPVKLERWGLLCSQFLHKREAAVANYGTKKA